MLNRRQSGKLYKTPVSPSNKNYIKVFADKSGLDANSSAHWSPEQSPQLKKYIGKASSNLSKITDVKSRKSNGSREAPKFQAPSSPSLINQKKATSRDVWEIPESKKAMAKKKDFGYSNTFGDNLFKQDRTTSPPSSPGIKSAINSYVKLSNSPLLMQKNQPQIAA